MIEAALVVAFGLIGLAFAGYLARWVVAQPAGDPETARVAGLIRSAAEGFYRRQSGAIGAISAALGGAIFLAYGLIRREPSADPVPPLELGVWLTSSFAAGAAVAVAAGRAATWIATRAIARVAVGARRSLDDALTVALRGGAVSGLILSAASVLGLALLFAAVVLHGAGLGADPAAAVDLATKAPIMISGYALGASFAALLAQLGGGTFSKAADLGADMAAREAGIPEDDAQNPAAVADLAGDVVGGCAARGAGLFGSTTVETVGAMLVGAMLFRQNASLPSAGAVVLFPLVSRAFGVLAAIFGVMVVKTDDREHPMSALGRGLYVTALLHAVGTAGAAKWLLGPEWPRWLACAATGIVAAVATFHAAHYFTEHRFRPVREVAEASRGGATLAVLQGLTAGIEAAVIPFAVVAAGGGASYVVGASTGLAGGGLFGAAVATTGMLGTAAYVAAMDAFGPIVDGAGGIVEMTIARDRPDVRGRTVALDAVGNSTKAWAKAYAGGSAALGSLLVVAAYLDEVRRRGEALGHKAASGLSLTSPEVFVGAACGIALVLWFSGRCLGGTTRAARRVIDEARRQLKDVPVGFVPDHEACVEMVSRAALREMLVPALVVTVAPIALGLALRLARTEDTPHLAADSVAALVLAGTIAGALGSLLLGSAGGAWDNAKKYIITGAHGGRHLVDETGSRAENPAYGAAAVGDAVGDSLKDALGPAIHALVKMLSVATLVFLPFFV